MMYELTVEQLEQMMDKAKKAGVAPDSKVYLYDANGGTRMYWTATGVEVDDTVDVDDGPMPLSVAKEQYEDDGIEPDGKNLVLIYGD